MLSRTRVPRWAPPLGDAVRLAGRPALVYFLFCALGSVVFFATFAVYSADGTKDFLMMGLGLAFGMLGIVLGMLLAMLRLRALPVFILTAMCLGVVAWLLAAAKPPGGEVIAVSLLFFSFAFPCGLLALMHRYEIFASFWPAVGWIGSVFIVINHEGRVKQWEENKITAWLPLPLVFLACFLVFWLFYFAAKQAARVEMWQALSGAAARRIAKRDAARNNRVGALPRRNIVVLLAVAAVLFGATALLSPYLWRTGRGDKGTKTQEYDSHDPPKPREKPTPNIDGEAIVRELQKMASAAKQTLPKLWPLLFLLLLYRPAKRALLLTHLKAPIVPTPPSERIDNLWEYVRIAAEDAGIVPTSADSIEELLGRIDRAGKTTPSLLAAAEIYRRTRYGFVVVPGDAIAMRHAATEAATGLRRGIGAWPRVAGLWRGLA